MLWVLPITSLIISTAATSLKYEVLEVEDQNYWISMASARLDEVLTRKQIDSMAKNVIIFIGDGMGMSTITAGRIYQGQSQQRDGEGNILSFEKFPVTGLSKTYNFDTQVSDSASTATAIFSGVKTRLNVVGLDSLAAYKSCMVDTNKKAAVTTIMNWAQDRGKSTGIITTTRITHATPAATYAHVNDRDWECDSKIPAQDVGCIKDIARQLVEDAPGKNFKVILGGGRNQMGDSKDNSKNSYCVRGDGRNLAMEWKNSKMNAKYVTTAEELHNVDVNRTDYLLGLFSADHMNYSAERDPNRPSLKKMTETAIKIVEKNHKGYVLMVEAGRIDQGHHNNTPGLALPEVVDLDEAVEAAVKMTNPQDTLIIVTADHSHSVTINGYPKRGNDILGLAANKSDSYFETLTYANGPGFTDHYLVENEEHCRGNCSQQVRDSLNAWKDIRNDTSRSKNIYNRHLAASYLPDETHSGEDVPIYATGPMAHLLIGVHEQNYIASVISYAACIGPEAKRCTGHKMKSSSNCLRNNLLLNILLGLSATLLKI